MNFSQMMKNFSASLPGTETFKLANAECLAVIRDEPFQASAAFLIAGFCRSYVLIYEEEALEMDFARRNHNNLHGYMKTLDLALATYSPEDVLKALNDVVHHYVKSDRIF
ncbi:hypothetical protein [Pseudomonas sp. ME-P-057]|jgi:hypothetical protein|uniref:hypothetical protein n=1 Tax=Pseudomonas sp. ME-P-057 TaxID=3040321 RepID=UPI00255468A8|nr:hypothetical protein [Pseudomonas sp. ME-P-057]